MASEEDTSTRTIASVAAAIGLIALLLTGVDSASKGLLAQYVGTAKVVGEQSDAALLQQINALAERVTALESNAAAAPVAAPAAEAAEEAPK